MLTLYLFTMDVDHKNKVNTPNAMQGIIIARRNDKAVSLPGSRWYFLSKTIAITKDTIIHNK